MLRELIQGYSSLSLIGMCKNAGKTTVLNRIIYELRDAGLVLGLTSIGRDGEAIDVVTGTSKPGIFIYENTLVATASDMLTNCDITREILSTTGFYTPLGEVAIVRARSDGRVQLAGPSMTAQLTRLASDFAALGASMTIIDGALSRKTLCAPAVSEATVLCTGASYNRDINTVVDDTAFAASLLMLPKQTAWSEEETEEAEVKLRLKLPSGETVPLFGATTLTDAFRDASTKDAKHVFIAGAVTDALIRPLLQSGAHIEGVEFTAYDGSKFLIKKDIVEKLKIRGASFSVARRVSVAAITVNPVSAYGFDMDSEELIGQMRAKVGVPVLDVMSDGEEIYS